MKHEAVIFDLDGTLLNTLADLADAMNAVLEEDGYPTHPESAYRRFIGGGVEELGELALPPEARTKNKIIECVRRMVAMYRKNWAVKTVPYPGIMALLDALSSAGIAMAVLSNKMHDFAVEMVGHYFPAVPFVAILGAGDEYPVKPDPAGALEVARRLGVLPKRCLLVGDSGGDMITAKRAGMAAAGVLWGYRDREELVEAGADGIFESAGDLLKSIL